MLLAGEPKSLGKAAVRVPVPPHGRCLLGWVRPSRGKQAALAVTSVLL